MNRLVLGVVGNIVLGAAFGVGFGIGFKAADVIVNKVEEKSHENN